MILLAQFAPALKAALARQQPRVPDAYLVSEFVFTRDHGRVLALLHRQIDDVAQQTMAADLCATAVMAQFIGQLSLDSSYFTSTAEQQSLLTMLSDRNHCFLPAVMPLLTQLDWAVIGRPDTPEASADNADREPTVAKDLPDITQWYARCIRGLEARAQNLDDLALIQFLRQNEVYLKHWFAQCLLVPYRRVSADHPWSTVYHLLCDIPAPILARISDGQRLQKLLQLSKNARRVFFKKEPDATPTPLQEPLVSRETVQEQIRNTLDSFIKEVTPQVELSVASVVRQIKAAQTMINFGVGPDQMRRFCANKDPLFKAEPLLGLMPNHWYSASDQSPLCYLGFTVEGDGFVRPVFRCPKQNTTLRRPLSFLLEREFTECAKPQSLADLDETGNRALVQIANDPAYRKAFLAQLDVVLNSVQSPEAVP